MLPGKSGPSSHVWLKREVDGYPVMHSNTGEEVENSRTSKGQLLPGVSTKAPPPPQDYVFDGNHKPAVTCFIALLQ